MAPEQSDKAVRASGEAAVDAVIEIRPPSASDLGALEDVKRRSTLATGEYVEQLLAAPEVMAIDPDLLDHALMALADGRVVGFVTLRPRDPGQIEIEDLFVVPEFWRRGVGVRLLRGAERIALEQDALKLSVVSGELSLAFYEACGFRTFRRVQTRFAQAVELVRLLR